MSSNKFKVGIIVQAHIGSTRLPGKVLKLLGPNETILDVLIKRLKLCKQVNEIIIATSPAKENQKIIDLVSIYNVPHFIGSEENVLERYYQTAKKFKIDIVVRITSDCPFIDPKVVDDMVVFYKNNKYDCVNNSRDAPNFLDGTNLEIISFKILEKIYHLAKSKFEKEHVTIFLYNHPEMFSIYFYYLPDLKHFEGLKLSVDWMEDLILCRIIYDKLKMNDKLIDFTIYDIIDIIDKEPELMLINKR